jgi:hypothetical protein
MKQLSSHVDQGSGIPSRYNEWLQVTKQDFDHFRQSTDSWFYKGKTIDQVNPFTQGPWISTTTMTTMMSTPTVADPDPIIVTDPIQDTSKIISPPNSQIDDSATIPRKGSTTIPHIDSKTHMGSKTLCDADDREGFHDEKREPSLQRTENFDEYDGFDTVIEASPISVLPCLEDQSRIVSCRDHHLSSSVVPRPTLYSFIPKDLFESRLGSEGDVDDHNIFVNNEQDDSTPMSVDSEEAQEDVDDKDKCVSPSQNDALIIYTPSEEHNKIKILSRGNWSKLYVLDIWPQDIRSMFSVATPTIHSLVNFDACRRNYIKEDPNVSTDADSDNVVAYLLRNIQLYEDALCQL